MIRLATRKAIQALENAIRQLEIFANEPGCGFCVERGITIKTAVEELQEVLPIAEEMKEKIDKLSSDSLFDTISEIREFKDELTSASPDQLAGSGRLRRSEGGASTSAGSHRPGTTVVQLPSPSIFDREAFQEAKEFFRMRPMLRDMIGGLRAGKTDRFRIFGSSD